MTSHPAHLLVHERLHEHGLHHIGDELRMDGSVANLLVQKHAHLRRGAAEGGSGGVPWGAVGAGSVCVLLCALLGSRSMLTVPSNFGEIFCGLYETLSCGTCNRQHSEKHNEKAVSVREANIRVMLIVVLLWILSKGELRASLAW